MQFIIDFNRSQNIPILVVTMQIHIYHIGIVYINITSMNIVFLFVCLLHFLRTGSNWIKRKAIFLEDGIFLSII